MKCVASSMISTRIAQFIFHKDNSNTPSYSYIYIYIYIYNVREREEREVSIVAPLRIIKCKFKIENFRRVMFFFGESVRTWRKVIGCDSLLRNIGYHKQSLWKCNSCKPMEYKNECLDIERVRIYLVYKFLPLLTWHAHIMSNCYFQLY